MRKTIRGLLAAVLFTPLLALAQEADEPSLILPPDPAVEEPEPVQREPTAPPLEQPPPQQPQAEAPPPAPPPAYAERERERRRDRDRAEEREVTVMGQAGLLTYVGEAASVTSPGATYGVSIGTDLTRGINAEIGYVGSSYRTEEGEGVGGRTSLIENGAQALMKVGPEIGQVQPYGMWGFQVSRLNALEGPGENNPLVRDATLFKLPLGAGIAWEVPSDAIADVNIGAQAAYNFALDSGAYPTLDDPLASNQFTTTVMVGGRF